MTTSKKSESTPAEAGIDLGDDVSFPREYAPHTADGWQSWVRKALTTPREHCRDAGVPPAAQLGTVRGFVDACDVWLQHKQPEAAAEKIRWLREMFTDALEGVE